MTAPTAQTADAMAFDQYGVAPEKSFGSKEHARPPVPCWPPLGFNIVLKAPADVMALRNAWPKGQQGGFIAGSACVGFITQPVPGAVTMGVEDPSQKIMKLKELLDAGALTQDEFDKKKAEILKKM